MSIQGSDDFLFEKTKAAVLVFDQLFAQIAPCRKYNQDIRQQSLEIPVTSLSDIQCNAISTMSGYLERIYNELERRHLESYQKTTLLANLSTLSTDPYPTTVLTQQQLLKKVHLLQDFLINELVRTEELEASVGKLEEKLLIANENCAKMEKKLKKTEFISIETRKATLQISSSPSSVAVPRLDTTKQPVDDHGKYVGQFIRKPFAGKKFFGLICNYSNPYFQIVYEDADFEEADYNEIIKYLWRHDVPTAKRAACYKHAKAEAKLGPLLLKESDILKGEDEIRDSPEPGRDKPAVLGNSLAATSTQPFHEGILSKPSIKSKSASSDVTRHKFSHSTGTLEKRYMLSASKFPVTPSSQQPIGGAPNPSTSATSVTPDHEIVNSVKLLPSFLCR